MKIRSPFLFNLQVKVALTAIAGVLVMAMVLVANYNRQMARDAEESLRKRAAAITISLVNECEYGLLAGHKKLLHEAASKALRHDDVVSVVVFDEEGRLMASAGQVHVAVKSQQGPHLVRQHLNASSALAEPPLKQNYFALFYAPVLLQTVDSALDLESDESGANAFRQPIQRLGLIELTVSRAPMELAAHQARMVAGWITLVSALSVSLLCLFLAQRIIRPLRALADGTKALADGNLAARIRVSSSDEVGEVAQAFNEMANSLQRSHQEVLKYQHDLERRVDVRTAALQESNQQLRDAEAKHRTLVEQLPGITYITEIGADGRCSYVSPQVQTMLGFSPAEWMADPGLRAKQTHPDDRETVRAEKSRLEKEGGTYSGDCRITSCAGKSVWFRDLAVVICDETGRPRHWQGVLLDITEAKQAEDKFLQAQKVEAIGQLAGGVAHDFNNILTAITGYSELTQRHLASDDPIRHNIEEIRKAADRAAGLTRQLLAFSRKQTLQPKVIALNAVLVDMDKMLRRLIGEHIDLVALPGLDLGRVKVDPAQIEQILINLAVNARDAMPYGGSLTIETKNATLDAAYARTHADVAPGRYVMLAVSDTGVGMTDEVKTHLFEPFYTTKGIGKGTGLGLATCYGIVKQSSGHIAVYSEPGRGTTFKIYLPLVDAEADALQDATSDTLVLGGQETVLLVEDEQAVREMATLVLGELGYYVLAAANGVEALEVLAQRDGTGCDLLVTDVVMPRMGGRELAAELAAKHPGVKVLFTSGYTDDAIVHHGVLEPGIAFLQKPYTTAALAGKIRSILDAAAGVKATTASVSSGNGASARAAEATGVSLAQPAEPQVPA